MTSKVFTGGGKLESFLKNLARELKDKSSVDVGFMADATESKNSVKTALVAYRNEFGGTIPERTVSAHMTTINRQFNKKGQLLNGGQFAKKSKSTKATQHAVPEHVIPAHTVPARPFFRAMIAKGEKHWGKDLGTYLTKNKYNVAAAAAMMGEQMTDELKESIQAPGYAPLAKSTIKAKGFDTTLVDTGDMLNAATYRTNIK